MVDWYRFRSFEGYEYCTRAFAEAEQDRSDSLLIDPRGLMNVNFRHFACFAENGNFAGSAFAGAFKFDRRLSRVRDVSHHGPGPASRSGLAKIPDSTFWYALWHYGQDHVQWVGFILHDVIQPSFSFLVGVVLPFSIASRMMQEPIERTAHRSCHQPIV